jgi:hypothetical protein
MNDETDKQPEPNPLNSQFWMREYFPKADSSLASLGEKLSGIDALARVLANNMSLAIDARDNPESTDIQPLNENIVGGLFSALTALTSSAFGSVWDMVERSHKAKEAAA